MADDNNYLKYAGVALISGSAGVGGYHSMSFNDEITLCLPLIQNEIKHQESACRDRIQDVNVECALIILKAGKCD